MTDRHGELVRRALARRARGKGSDRTLRRILGASSGQVRAAQGSLPSSSTTTSTGVSKARSAPAMGSTGSLNEFGSAVDRVRGGGRVPSLSQDELIRRRRRRRRNQPGTIIEG